MFQKIRRARAIRCRSSGRRSLADYGPACSELVFGGPPEFQTRPDGLPGIKQTYGCTFKEFRALDTGGPAEQEVVAALARVA